MILSSAKRLAQMSSLSLPVVNLMPGVQWAVLKEEKVLALLVEVILIRYYLFEKNKRQCTYIVFNNKCCYSE